VLRGKGGNQSLIRRMDPLPHCCCSLDDGVEWWYHHWRRNVPVPELEQLYGFCCYLVGEDFGWCFPPSVVLLILRMM